jgi:hypothetical protein
MAVQMLEIINQETERAGEIVKLSPSRKRHCSGFKTTITQVTHGSLKISLNVLWPSAKIIGIDRVSLWLSLSSSGRSESWCPGSSWCRAF